MTMKAVEVKPSRPRRSILFMPASNTRAAEKARTLPADCIVFDLEDAIAPEHKDTARATACETVGAGGFGRRELIIRVNALDTPWAMDDIVAVARSGAHALALPKAERAQDLARVEEMMRSAGAPEDMGIWCLIETPLGILRAEEIAASSPRLQVILIGLADLGKELHSAHTADRTPFSWALGMVLLAARAYGIDAIDGIHPDINDDEGFAASCRHGRALGFDGKTLIHPRTIDVANAIFAPTEEETSWSKKIISAHEEARRNGVYVTQVDGKIVEHLHVERARRLLDMAAAISGLQT